MPRSQLSSKYPKKRLTQDRETAMDIYLYVSLNRKLLKFVGLYPQNRLKSFIATFLMSLLVVPAVLQIYQSRDLRVILETSTFLIMSILGILKVIVWSRTGKKMDDFITYMFGDYWDMINFEDKAASCFLRYAEFSKQITKWNSILVGSVLFFFCGVPLVTICVSNMIGSLNKTRAFLAPGIYPEGWKESPIYEIILLLQAIVSSSGGAVLLATDTFLATAIFHTCGHFKIVQENLRSIGDDVNLIIDSDYDRRKEESVKILARQKLGACVKHHQDTLRFCETMESLFNPMMFCQVLASVTVICLIGLELILIDTDPGSLVKYASSFVLTLFQLLLFCLPCDDLIDQSLLVADAAYATNWQYFDNLFGTEVCLIIVRAQKPAKVTAGKFTTMSLEHFAAVLNTSLSYFTVLRSVSIERRGE